MGLSGDCVVPHMTVRLAQTLRNASKAGTHYTVLILLAGINDLGIQAHVATVFDGITTMIREAVTHKAKVLLLTLLGTKMANTKNDASRVHLNHRLRRLVKHPDLGASVTILDMDVEMPYGEAQRAGLFDDGIHLSPKGYDKMGQVVYRALLPLLEKVP